MRATSWLVVLFCLVTGCSQQIVHTLSPGATDSTSIWVSIDGQVYRCTDGAAAGQTPKPVCVRTVRTAP
jgi:hypothetical protein